MKTPLILKCSGKDCNRTLNEFETRKWNSLLDYWGGNTRGNQPLCFCCYHKELETRKARYEKTTNTSTGI